MRIRCPHCHNPVEVVEDSDYRNVDCPSCGSHFNLIGGDTEDYQPSHRKIAQFTLKERLGVGAFGSVYKAHDANLDRIVAVKIPRNEQIGPEEREKFLREARAAAQLKHPNIVSVHEVGRDGETVYIASDFVDGVTLQSRLTANHLSIDESVALLAKIATAVEHANHHGVIHRDLKPGNIMLDASGEPHVMDFGLAKRETGEITMTLDGARLGTPAYMPPEQIGQAHDADARSDVYSLGVVLYELLTGELPFRGDQAVLLHQVMNSEPSSPRKLNSRVSRDLETITLKCLRKEPSLRYQTAGELAEDLGRAISGTPISARPISFPNRAIRYLQRQAPLVRAMFLAVLIGGSIAGLFTVSAIAAKTLPIAASDVSLDFARLSSPNGWLWLSIWLFSVFLAGLFVQAVFPGSRATVSVAVWSSVLVIGVWSLFVVWHNPFLIFGVFVYFLILGPPFLLGPFLIGSTVQAILGRLMIYRLRSRATSGTTGLPDVLDVPIRRIAALTTVALVLTLILLLLLSGLF